MPCPALVVCLYDAAGEIVIVRLAAWPPITAVTASKSGVMRVAEVEYVGHTLASTQASADVGTNSHGSWVSWLCCGRLGSQNSAITGLEPADSVSDRRGER